MSWSHKFRFFSALSTAAATLLAAPTPHARADSVYEGWAYAPGPHNDLVPAGGLGWEIGSGYPGAIAIAPASLTHPSALPSTGNALTTSNDAPFIFQSRPLATPLDPANTTWLSFLARRDAADASYLVGVNASPGFGVWSLNFGIENNLDGRPAYRARWERSTFFVTGETVFADAPTTPVGSTDFFLVRMNPADIDAGTRSVDVWINPDVSALGAPSIHLDTPAATVPWQTGLWSQSASTSDEFRIGDSLAAVANVPAPAGAVAFLLGSITATRRRRASSRPSLRA